MWVLGAIVNDAKVMNTGRRATQAVLAADALVGAIRAARQPQTFAPANALRTFAFASVVARQYRHRPAVALGVYGFATAASFAPGHRARGFRRTF
jgi:hypothetical protein